MSSQAESSTSVLDWLKWAVVVAIVAAAVAGNAIYGDQSLLLRVVVVLAMAGVAVFVALTTAKGKQINQLRKEAWIEVRRMVRPTRQETVQTTLLVLAVVLIVALCLWVVDWMISSILSLFLG